MVLTKEKVAELDRAALKHVLAEKLKFSALSSLRREAGNAIKGLGVKVTVEEFMEYTEGLIREVFEEKLAQGKRGK